MYIVLDTNIYLHYLPFEEIPWSDLLGTKDVVVVITATILEEIDNKKDEEK